MTANVTLMGDLDLKSPKYEQNQIPRPPKPQKRVITHDCSPFGCKTRIALNPDGGHIGFCPKWRPQVAAILALIKNRNSMI